MQRSVPGTPRTFILLLCLLAGCSGGAGEKQAAEELRKLGVLVVNDVNQRASSLVVPDDAEKIRLAIPLIPKLVYLTSFSGINTPITDGVLVSVGKVKGLTNVDLSGTEISDTGIVHLTGLRKLASLSLANSRVTSDCLPELAKLKNLEILNLAHNDIRGGFEHLRGCRQLTWLVLSHLKLSDADVAAIAKYPNLKRLSISSEVEISEAGKQMLREQGIQLDLDDAGATSG